jgi:hypothetical protein
MGAMWRAWVLSDEWDFLVAYDHYRFTASAGVVIFSI